MIDVETFSQMVANIRDKFYENLEKEYQAAKERDEKKGISEQNIADRSYSCKPDRKKPKGW